MAAASITPFWLSGNWTTTPSTWGARTFTGTAIAAGDVVIKAGSGTLKTILVVTDNGANPVPIYDNSSKPIGTVLAVVPANAKAGTIITFNTITNNQVGYTFGLVIKQTAAAGDLTIQY